jgi:subtilisin-like proprotein convertase family protein
MGLRALAILAILGLTLPFFAADGIAPASAKPKIKEHTRSFTNSTPITIVDNAAASVYPSTIQVSGFTKGQVLDVNLTLRGLSHEFPGDIQAMLVAPNGRHAVVMGDAGTGLDITNITVTLDDEANQILPINDQLTTGTYLPNDLNPLGEFPSPAPTRNGDTALATFDGSDPNGQWQLFIADCCPPGSGSLANGWTLEITGTTKIKKHKHHKH